MSSEEVLHVTVSEAFHCYESVYSVDYRVAGCWVEDERVLVLPSVTEEVLEF
jgi:hypothetical protein